MGYPYNGLIPAAILLENPGITREEFVQLLDETHSSSIGSCKKRSRWNSFGKADDETFHEGLHGLASILSLKFTEQYKQFCQSRLDENGLTLNHPQFFVRTYKRGVRWMPKFKVIVHEKNELGNIEELQAYSWDKLREGDIWIEPQIGLCKGLVKKVIEEKELPESEEAEENPLTNAPSYEYKMVVQSIDEIKRRQIFFSLQELTEKWPQFDPDFMYNFSKDNGGFSTMVLNPNDGFRWMQKGNKYYLDEEYTFNNIPAGFGNLKFGYTDLILTAEAIKNKAWRLLTYRGRDHLNYFFKKFPESYHRYAQAVWDSHTSLYAKHTGLGTSDFLRLRMHGD